MFNYMCIRFHTVREHVYTPINVIYESYVIFHFFHTKGWFPAFPTSGAKAEDKHSWEPLAGGELTSLKGEMYIGKDLSGSSAANSGNLYVFRIYETRVACFSPKKAIKQWKKSRK